MSLLVVMILLLLLLLLTLRMALPSCKAKHVHNSLQGIAIAAVVVRRVIVAAVVDVGRCSSERDFGKLSFDLGLHLQQLWCCYCLFFFFFRRIVISGGLLVKVMEFRSSASSRRWS